ncbi:23529_t:CDS:2, partial [Gigaspora margarita]
KFGVCTIKSPANVCCVKFNPEIPHHIAFGSADHHINYYDLWYNRQPVFIYKGHRKAVSYVKFMGRNELISACGSEDNCIYAYYKTLCRPVIKYKFGKINAVTGEETFDNDPSLFVSSVCWKKSPSTLLVANSQGTIKVLELE